MKFKISVLLTALLLSSCCSKKNPVGSIVFVIERENQSVAAVSLETLDLLKRIPVSGNMRHAAMAFSPALDYGYIATRNGVMTRINLSHLKEEGHLKTSDNSIGIAISQDGETLAVAEYLPGGITFINRKNFKITQKITADIKDDSGKPGISRTAGLVDGPGNKFYASLMDSNEIWQFGKRDNEMYEVKNKYKTAVKNPFDALITPDGRYYITVHFQTDFVSAVDTWSDSDQALSLQLDNIKDKTKTTVKLAHMGGWSVTGDELYIPVTDRARLAVLSRDGFRFKKSIPLLGNPVYTMVHPNSREIWVTFSGDSVDGKIQVIHIPDGKTIEVIDAGKRIYHLAFTPRGDKVMVSSNQTNELIFLDGNSRKIIKKLPLKSPSGIFGVWRAFQAGF